MAPAVTSDASPCARASHLHAETVSTLPQNADLAVLNEPESVLELKLAMSTVQGDVTVSGNSTTGIHSCVLSTGSQVAVSPVAMDAPLKQKVELTGSGSGVPEPVNGIPAPSVANMATTSARIANLKEGQQRTLNLLLKNNNGKCNLQENKFDNASGKNSLLQTACNGGYTISSVNNSTSSVPPQLPNKPVATSHQSANRMAVASKSEAKLPNIKECETAVHYNLETLSPSIEAIDKDSSTLEAPAAKLDSICVRQKGLQLRVARLLCRLRRLQTREANSFVKQQLGGLVSFLRRPKGELAVKGGSIDDHTTISDYRNLSTSQLVGLVHRMQSANTTVFPGDQGLPSGSGALNESLCTGLADTAGKLTTNLRHLEQAVDSDATESSSGGESDDDDFTIESSSTSCDS